MTRCDLRTHRECACEPGQCRVQRPVIEILREANNGEARHGPALLALLAFIVFAIVIGLGAHAGPINV